MPQSRVQSDSAPAPIGPYSQGVSIADLIFCSGQAAVDPATGKLIEGDVQAQTHQTLKNLSAVLEAAGSDLGHVVKTTVFLAEMSDFKAMNEIYATYFSGVFPARSTIAAKALPLGALVEIEAIAIKK